MYTDFIDVKFYTRTGPGLIAVVILKGSGFEPHQIGFSQEKDTLKIWLNYFSLSSFVFDMEQY